MMQYVLTCIQMLGAVAAALSAYGAYRARDNERAAALAEIKADLRAALKRLDNLEDALSALNADWRNGKRGIA